MKLETYLKEQDITDAAFGEAIGLSQPQVSRIKRGKSWPAREVIERIVRETNGAVTANDFLQFSDTPLTAEIFDAMFGGNNPEASQ